MSQSDSEKPKIIIDEDWKAQVEREKEEVVDAPEDAAGADAEEVLPPASFATLVMTLATQAMGALGQLQEPTEDGKVQVQLPVGKHLIDTLAVLEEKTKGNLSAEETTMLENVLNQLRMLYVEVGKMIQSDGE